MLLSATECVNSCEDTFMYMYTVHRIYLEMGQALYTPYFVGMAVTMFPRQPRLGV